MPRSFKRNVLTSLSTSLGILVLDVTDSITPNYTSSLTEHPIEDGSHINDHVTHQTPTLSVKGLVTDARFRSVAGQQSQINAKDYLIKVRTQGLLVTYTDHFQIRENMIITSVTFPVGTENMGLPVELELKQATFVKTTPTTTTVAIRTKPADEKGTQSGSTSERSLAVLGKSVDATAGENIISRN